MEPASFIMGCGTGIAVILVVASAYTIIRPWVRLKTHGGKGSLPYVLFMRLRGNPVVLVIDAYLGLLHSGAITTLREVEAHYVANRSKIFTAEDLISSIRRDPIETHICVWLEHDDAEWLSRHLHDSAKAIRDELKITDDQFDENDMTAIASRYERIARRTDSAMAKVQRARH